MKSYTLTTFCADGPSVCALGCFDGVHIGHASLINEAKRIARERELPSVVWSFAEPPKNFFSPGSVPLLTPPAEKRELMRKLSVDCFICVPFEKSISELSAEEFFEEILLKKIKAAHLVCGFNYRFGKGGKGDTRLLATLCERYGVGLSVIPPIKLEDITVSSSAIRTALENGRADEAAELMGRPYSLRAKIVDGQHLGRRLGFPTLNQLFEGGKLVPKHGVYVTRVRFEGKIKYGITNVGQRPTVDGHTLCAETNVFDFSGDLYGKTVTVEFLQFIRPERKFDSLAELSAQVNADIDTAKNIINEKPTV